MQLEGLKDRQMNTYSTLSQLQPNHNSSSLPVMLLCASGYWQLTVSAVPLATDNWRCQQCASGYWQLTVSTVCHCLLTTDGVSSVLVATETDSVNSVPVATDNWRCQQFASGYWQLSPVCHWLLTTDGVSSMLVATDNWGCQQCAIAYWRCQQCAS